MKLCVEIVQYCCEKINEVVGAIVGFVRLKIALFKLGIRGY